SFPAWGGECNGGCKKAQFGVDRTLRIRKAGASIKGEPQLESEEHHRISRGASGEGSGATALQQGEGSVALTTPKQEFRPTTAGRGSAMEARANPQAELDDHYLVALAKDGRTDAYDAIVKRYRGFVRLKASSYFLLGGESDDLIHEGLLGLYKAIRDYRTDRESSFRNFAELCITRQIIPAVKTATRNKHTPLNQYVSFSQTPAAAGDSDTTLDEILPG